MNNFFTSIGPNLARNMRDQWLYAGNEIDNNVTNNVEVLNFLKGIDITKSSAVPQLSSKILKPAFILLIDKLTFIYNLCFKNSIFPNAWKRAIVTPLLKDGDLSQCTNYRPISQLPLPGKILEQIIHSRIDNIL